MRQAARREPQIGSRNPPPWLSGFEAYFIDFSMRLVRSYVTSFCVAQGESSWKVATVTTMVCAHKGQGIKQGRIGKQFLVNVDSRRSRARDGRGQGVLQ